MLKRLLSFITIGSIAVLIVFSGCAKEEKSNESKQAQPETRKNETVSNQGSFIGSEAPGFDLEDLSGKKVTLEQFSGKVVLLNFWGTWCPPCRKEIPDMVEMYSEYKDEGLEIVGVTLNSGSPQEIQKFVYKNDINYHVLTGEKEYTMNLAKKYDNIRGIPTTFVIDRNGIVQHKWVGPRSKEKFMEVINEYL